MKKTTAMAIAFVAIVVGFIVYSTFHQQRTRCRVCMSFNGQRDCRVVSSATRDDALRTAVSNACAQLASGVTETTQCQNTKPDSIEWLQ